MPIRIPNDLPAAQVMQQENIFVMKHQRATTQHIRPLEIVVLNLMPTKIVTETQFTRLLGNTPLQVNLELMHTSTHRSKNVSEEHLLTFYKTFEEVAHKKYDSMCSADVCVDWCVAVCKSSNSTCRGVLPIRRAICVSVTIFCGIRFNIRIFKGRMSWVIARVSVMTKIFSFSNTCVAGNKFGILIGIGFLLCVS